MSHPNYDFIFSNFDPSPITYQGIIFPTVENFYQAMKFPKERWLQVSQMAPTAAKKFGKGAKLRKDWHTIKYKVMEYALRQKFAPGTPSAQLLLDYEGELVEWNTWHDNDWGDCICWETKSNGYRESCRQPGQNHLGKLLTKIRRELILQ